MLSSWAGNFTAVDAGCVALARDPKYASRSCVEGMEGMLGMDGIS
jgi:hypothetical protein